MSGFDGQIIQQSLGHKLFNFIHATPILGFPLLKQQPLEALTVFTDASVKMGKAAYVWQENAQWHHQAIHAEDGCSTQYLELLAVVLVFEWWNSQPINVVCDSQYVVGIVYRIEQAYIKELQHEKLYLLFCCLFVALAQCSRYYYICHIRSHTAIDSILTQGNARADLLVSPAWAAPPRDLFSQARQSHEFFHQSAKVLQ